ncbi:MAG: hypothetical protein ABSC18_12260 [Verrucomicrobiota bacterium]|jgi:hypothetical protein
MKNPISRTALAAITATAICLGAFGSVAGAQNSVSNQAGAAQTPALPSGVSEVTKMFKGGISADIMVSYINNSPLSFYLSADNLIALQQEGVPTPVLTAMMRRYGELQRQTGMAAGAPIQVPAQAAAPQYAGAPVQVPAQAPAPQYYSYDSYAPAPPPASYSYVAAPSYPVYGPYYYDPFYYPWYPFGGPVVFDFGFGRFGGYGGHWGGGGRFGGGGWRR